MELKGSRDTSPNYNVWELLPNLENSNLEFKLYAGGGTISLTCIYFPLAITTERKCVPLTFGKALFPSRGGGRGDLDQN